MNHVAIKSILSLIIILANPMIVVGQKDDHTTYISYVDEGLGFYKVRDVTNPDHKFEYKDRTLIINQGDTIVWQNDAEKATFTIASEQNLWDNTVGYLRAGSKLNYKFEKSGKYNIYIKEYSQKRQTIIVNPIEGELPSSTTTIPKKTPVVTPGQKEIIDISKPNINKNVNNSINNPIDDKSDYIYQSNTPDINLLAKMPATTVASIIVALLTMIITFLVGRNRR